MGRQARQLSSSGVYHVMFRGITHGHLFENRHDFWYMTGVIQEVKDIFGFEIYAYWYMNNHVHLVLLFSERHQCPTFGDADKLSDNWCCGSSGILFIIKK